MEEMKKPAIRLAEFTDAWECCPLSDYLDVSNEKNNELLFSKDDVLSVSGDYGIVNQIAFKGRSFAGESVENYGVVHTGDVVYTKSPLKANPYGIIKANKGTAGIVSTLYAIYHPKENVDSSFVQTYFEQHARMNSYMNPLVNKGAKNDMKVSAENALKGLVVFPEIEEQKRIVHQFECLDDCISLAQQKYDKLLTFKKSMLEKMFPQNGAKVPEVRFAGFTDDWEQRKCGDVLTESREIGHKGDKAKKITVKLWGKGVYEKVEEGSENTQYFTRHKGQFIYSKLDFLNSAFGVVPENLEGYETTADVPAFNCDGINPYFMFYKAIQKDFYLTNGMIADGSRKAKRIHADTFLEMPILLPTIEEQNKIVDHLQTLDNFITLHQCELEKLKNIKSALLEKMFV